MKVDLEKLEALVHTFPYPTAELAVCVEQAIAELRAARALIASVDRYHFDEEDGGSYECTSCHAIAPVMQPVPHGNDWPCAWVAYDAATSRATLGKSPP